jgi:hypothetical protein
MDSILDHNLDFQYKSQSEDSGGTDGIASSLFSNMVLHAWMYNHRKLYCAVE